jgi:hypothetical protein
VHKRSRGRRGNKRPLWDIVLFYAKGIEWDDHPPKPSHWAKQIAYYGRQEDGTSGLFWRNDFGMEPVASDWFVEVSRGMTALIGERPAGTGTREEAGGE